MADDLSLDSILGRMAREELPWDAAWSADFNAFSDRYTLHDSRWIGVFLPLGEGNLAVLAFEWDAHWLPESLRSECMADSPDSCPWPFLFMRISDLRKIQFSGYEEPVSGRTIGAAEFSQWEDVNVLEIRDLYGDGIYLDFSGPIEFLALRRTDCQVLGIEKTVPRL